MNSQSSLDRYLSSLHPSILYQQVSILPIYSFINSLASLPSSSFNTSSSALSSPTYGIITTTTTMSAATAASPAPTMNTVRKPVLYALMSLLWIFLSVSTVLLLLFGLGEEEEEEGEEVRSYYNRATPGTLLSSSALLLPSSFNFSSSGLSRGT